jgi:uncharacterized protein YcbK (DUF882 family)
MRRFWVNTAAIAALMLLATQGMGAGTAPDRARRELGFVHTHTGRTLEITYWRDGGYDEESLDAANEFLSDFRSKTAKEMDPALFDVLFELKQATGTREPFQVISAYRSPETNEMLRKRSSGVAKNSYHVRGQAIDVRLADVSTDKLRDVALNLKRGGVGYYKNSDFVHVDTGPIRRW